MQFYALNSAFVGSNVSTAQSVFGVGVTLSSSTVYAFEAVVALSKSAGTTAHTIGIGFGGTATLNSILYQILSNEATTALPASRVNQTQTLIVTNVATNTTIDTSNSTAALSCTYSIKGTVSVNAGGTFIPQYTLSAAPGGAYSTAAGSYIKIVPLAAAGSNVSIGTWS